jgi:glycosyltransferase involved in cell wall biosynthesis
MISVIVPTLNCVDKIDLHLESLRALKDGVKEFIFVDSSSEDGTAEKIAEFLRSGVSGILLSCPPGLYAAWNKGVATAKGGWVSFATVGDTQNPEGLQHLMEVAESFSADLVVSPPLMMSGRKSVEDSWPIHHLAVTKQSPHLMTQEESIRWLCSFLPGTALGSAASNLYRRKFLLDHPFPINFGHEGDVAWGIQVSTKVSLVVTPQTCAAFEIHGRSTPLDALLQKARFEQLVAHSFEHLTDFPHLLAEFQILWKRQSELLQWVIELENVAETNREQKSYIFQLENERKRLTGEVERLGKIPFTNFMPPLKMAHLGPLLRRFPPCFWGNQITLNLFKKR